MTPFEIPLKPQSERFRITLGGKDRQIKTRWNPASACWVIDLLDTSGVAILCGIPLVTGDDLAEQFAHLGIGGELIVQTDHDTDAVPTFENLGSSGHLYFVAETP